jgi:hypothetical protein
VWDARQFLARFNLNWFSTSRYWSRVMVDAARRRGREGAEASATIGRDVDEEGISREQRTFRRNVQDEIDKPDGADMGQG